MSVDEFPTNQQVEPAATFTGRTVALMVGALVAGVYLLINALAWSHEISGVPVGINGALLVLGLGMFMGVAQARLGDRLAEKFMARHADATAGTCACLVELVELRQKVASQGGALAAVEHFSAAVAGARVRPPRRVRRRSRIANGENVVELPSAETQDALRRVARRVIQSEGFKIAGDNPGDSHAHRNGWEHK